MSVGEVLLVDDDDAVRVVVAQALRRAGHRVRTAATLAELERELKLGAPDVTALVKLALRHGLISNDA